MRNRAFGVAAVVGAAGLVLSGCAGNPEPLDTPTANPADSTCMINAEPGPTSDAVTVEGSGADRRVFVPADRPFNAMERTVLRASDGAEVLPGDLVSVDFLIVSAADGSVLDSSERIEGGLLHVLLEPQNASLFVAALECEPVGTEVVLTLPASMLGVGAPDTVVYAKAVETFPLRATGTDVAPTPGSPTVELADDGAPTITVPQLEAPTSTEISVLKQGDGMTVGAGDLVTLQYRGVKWSDGSEFDSSWSRGAPAQFHTDQVVNGFRLALEGQKVGSQVLAVIPPSDGYGAAEDTNPLKNETLVFVVDILATSPVE